MARFVIALWVLAALALLDVFDAPAHAGVVMQTTRVVYPAQVREITVPLVNDNKHMPVLVQAWIDEGNEKSKPDQLKAPFLVVPPIFRMEPGQGQSLRITHLDDQPLPATMESVFWLNVLEVPPQPKAIKGEASNTLQLAFRTRIKLFFRPTGLTGTADDAPRQLRWALRQEGTRRALQVENPSAYYVSFDKVSLTIGGKDVECDDPQMIAPGGTQRFELGDVHWQGEKAEVRFTSIDDHGLIVPHVAPLAP